MKNPAPEPEVVHEFASIGKYRLRVVKSAAKQTLFDVREYVKGSFESFEGFTRRGIRIASKAEAEALRDVLNQILVNGMLE